jgi:hypothetical protein
MKNGFRLAFLHELDGSCAHAEDIHRVRWQMRCSVLIARVAIALVVTVRGGSTA